MEEIPAFMLYLLSRPIDAAKARIPLDNKKKEDLAALTEEPIVSAAREWVGTHAISVPQEPCNAPSTTAIARAMADDKLLNYVPHARKLVPVLRSLGGKDSIYNKQSVWTSVTLTPFVRQNNQASGDEWDSIAAEAAKG